MSRQPLSATLFKLHDPSNTGIAGSPLYRPVLNKFIAAVEPPSRVPRLRRQGAAGSRSMARLMGVAVGSNRARAEFKTGLHSRSLGLQTSDWHLRQFEVCPAKCELRYISNRKLSPDDDTESQYAPGFKHIGFIQAHTRVKTVPTIETVNEFGEKLCLWPFEVTFCNEEAMVGEKTCVIGEKCVCVSVSARTRARVRD